MSLPHDMEVQVVPGRRSAIHLSTCCVIIGCHVHAASWGSVFYHQRDTWGNHCSRGSKICRCKHFSSYELAELGRVAWSLKWWEHNFIFLHPRTYFISLAFFPRAKLQENICHGFKRFISFKAEGAGRPTHQWDHAILPALARMGWSMWTKFLS